MDNPLDDLRPNLPVVDPPEGTDREITLSRGKAVSRIWKGSGLSAFGMGLALSIDLFQLVSGLPGLTLVGTAGLLVGAGALWAGVGAKHLLNDGKRGSALALLSSVGLGGSVLIYLATTLLMFASTSPLLSVLNLVSLGASGVFLGVLVILTCVTLLKWLRMDAEPELLGLPEASS